jgi:hypothetical protein
MLAKGPCLEWPKFPPMQCPLLLLDDAHVHIEPYVSKVAYREGIAGSPVKLQGLCYVC